VCSNVCWSVVGMSEAATLGVAATWVPINGVAAMLGVAATDGYSFCHSMTL
jgi:hypothetical protein